jgi:D-threo-aldose 1-dehydrogenase
VTVTTKVGQVFGEVDHSRDAVLGHVEGSLERLGLDRFDVLYIHDAMDVPMDRVMGDDFALGALRQLQKEGVVKWVGTASNAPGTNIQYIETGEFDAAVIPECWSLLNQRAREQILPAAEKHNVGLVGATPLERGLLATGPVPGTNYLARRFTPEVLDHVATIQALCADHGVALNAVALQWCARHPQVAATIPGARTPTEAAANAEAGSAQIPDALWQDLDPLVRHWPVSEV